MKRVDPKESGSKNCDPKMVVKLSLATGSIGNTRSIGSIYPTIRGRLKETQNSTLSGGRARRRTAMSHALLPGGGYLMLQPGRSHLSVTVGPRLSPSLVLGGGRGGDSPIA